MKTIAVLNQKGGVGKSTTAAAVGSGLALRGYRVLFVDLDSQGNLSFTFNAKPVGYGSLGILQRPETARQEVQAMDGYSVIPAVPMLAAADTMLTETGKEFRLKEALALLDGDFDYGLVDTPPSLGVLTVNALTAADGVLIPCQADPFSLAGVTQLSGTVDAVRKYCNPGLKVFGILLCRFNGRSVIRRELAEMLKTVATGLNTSLFNVRIRENVSIVEAAAMKQSIFKYAPRSNAAADYGALIDELLTRMKG